jgi:hypothetical protein
MEQIMTHEQNLEPGCYADGALGQEHVRTRLAELTEALYAPHYTLPADLQDACNKLRNTMSDDDWETDLALDALNDTTPDGMCWMMDAGDLFYIAEGESK